MFRRPIITILILLTATAVGGTIWFGRVQTYHFAVVNKGILYRDGNRDLREFTHAVLRSRVKTVVTLIDDRELADPAKPQFAAEAAWCDANEIRQVRIPVKLGGWPTAADLKKFLDITEDPAAQPVLVHCAQGVRRTGIFVAAYQLAIEHQPPATVKGEILSFGHAPRDTRDIETFIDLFNPATRSLPPTTLPASAE